MLKKSTHLLALLTCFVIIASGCGKTTVNPKNAAEQTTPNPSQTSPTQTVSPAATSQTDEKEQPIKVYYGNEDGSALTEHTANIRFTTPSSKYLGALNALKQSQDAKAVPLCPDFMFKTAELKDGNLTVDLSFTPNDQLGSNGESLLMQAIPKTLFQFEEVKTIDLLVDGKKQDSLMGHVELPHPMTRQ
jgi:hypothetical protein